MCLNSAFMQQFSLKLGETNVEGLGWKWAGMGKI